MSQYPSLEKPHQADYEALIDNILRKGTPARPFHMELFHDAEIADAIADRYDLLTGLSADDPNFSRKKHIAIRRFLGFDYVRGSLTKMDMPLNWDFTEDSAELSSREKGRAYMNEHTGPISSWEDFEKYPWPDPSDPSQADDIEWMQENLPDDMCMVAHTGHFAEYLMWLFGYETLCYKLADDRDLVRAVADRVLEMHVAELEHVFQYDRVKMMWGSDDMGFKTGLLISPDDTREFILPGHKKLAEMTHAAGRPYLLHSCGNLSDIIDDLTDDVKIDGKHSYEDTIEDVREVKATYGQKIAMIGGIDVDFLCRSSEEAIRRRVRETLEICMPGGGYCLGTGNSVANYIPLDNYLAMIDEGWKFAS